MRRLGAWAVLPLLAAVACSKDPASTQIVVVVDSDMAVPAALDRVTIDVNGLQKAVMSSADLSKRGLPRSLGLFHESGPLGPIRVRARGFSGSAQVVERLAIVSFEQDKTLELRLPLSAACAAAEAACTGDTTCEAGSCTSAKQKSLPEFKGTVKGFDIDASLPDAGADAASDAASDNQKPECTISAPSDGATFKAGESVGFAGACQDAESGAVRVGLSWASDLSGMLGNGARISVNTLPPGKHVIEFCARDPQQLTLRGCTTIAITIEAAMQVSATITALAQGGNSSSPFVPTGTLTATGAGKGEEPLKLVWTDSLLGALGEGSSVSLDAPPKGKHRWTLTVTDARMQSATDSRSFAVTELGKPLVAGFSSVKLRFDVLVAASDGSVYAANRTARTVYAFDGAVPSSSLDTALDESKLPNVVRDIAIDELLGYVYIASKGFVACPFDASTGIDASGCMEYRGGMVLGSDENNAILRVTGSNNTHYLLVGSGKGVYVVDPGVTGLLGGVRKLPNVDVRAMTSVNGVAWLATASGLYSFDPVNYESQRISGGAPSDTLTSIAAGSDGSLWVGSANGIGRYVPSSHTWTVWRAGDAPAPGLASNEVRDIVVAPTKIGNAMRDIVWVATAAGVSRLDPTLPSFTTLTQEDGLPNNSVRAIVVLDGTRKVFATDSGPATYDGL
ncbi:MAG TPA: hypothetical protein VJR89_28505 [Polyangiales bacterium]|nr:hypothetical protein [Polyangiales bacterium]